MALHHKMIMNEINKDTQKSNHDLF